MKSTVLTEISRVFMNNRYSSDISVLDKGDDRIVYADVNCEMSFFLSRNVSYNAKFLAATHSGASSLAEDREERRMCISMHVDYDGHDRTMLHHDSCVLTHSRCT